MSSNTIIIKFAIRGTKITWLVNDNWVMVISFLLTLVIGKIYKRFKNGKPEIKLPNPKGGAFVDSCVDPDLIYELVDTSVAITVRRMLDLPSEYGPVVVSVPVLILGYIVAYQPLNQIKIMGVNFLFEKIKTAALKAAVGSAGGLSALALAGTLPIVSVTGAVLSLAIMFNVGFQVMDFECGSVVSVMNGQHLPSGKSIGFLDPLPDNSPKVYIQGSKAVEPYVLNSGGSCSIEYKETEVVKTNVRPVKREPQIEINKKCIQKYVPLNKRTKTYDDIRKEDSTEKREQAEPYIQRYEKRRKQIMEERVPKVEETTNDT